MKKHYVLIEYTPDMDIGAKDIPWPEILDGSVVVSNWKHITKESLNDFEAVAGIGQVFADTEGFTTEEILKIIGEDETQFPEGLHFCELYQYDDEDYAHRLVEEAGSGIVSEMCNFLQIDRWEMA